MKKFLIGAAMLLTVQMSFGQAVSDQAVIPVSVTLNAILRLTVTAGGNIQFVVNTMEQYTLGINTGSDQHKTRFLVSSSNNFDVTIAAEDDALKGIETGDDMDLGFILYNVGGAGGGIVAAADQALTDSKEIIITQDAGNQLEYEIDWQLGPNLLDENYAADVYVTNVYLQVAPQ